MILLDLADDAMLTLHEAASALNMSYDFLRNRVAVGDCPSYVFGRSRRVRACDLRAWVNAHRIPRKESR